MADVERITGQVNMSTFDNDIELFLNMFCEQEGIEDMTKAPQRIWNAALMYIRRHVFGDKSMLKVKGGLSGYDNSAPGLNKSNCNAYNIDLLNDICDYYIYICAKNNKEVSVNGYAYMLGIDPETIRAWSSTGTGHYRNTLNTAGSSIYEKLYKSREESLTAKLVDSGNPVGTIAILNKHYGYNMPGVRAQEERKQLAGVDDIKALALDPPQDIASEPLLGTREQDVN